MSATVEGRHVANSSHAEKAGDFWWSARSDNGQVGSLLLLCPACGSRHSVPVKPGRTDGWEWNGDRERPTLSPSIHFAYGHGGENEDCRWHGWLRDGVWISV